MYPNHPKLYKLVYALNTMTRGRPSNKRYGWVKRRWQKVCKARVGEKNGSFGRSWYYDPETLKNKKCLPEEVPEGFVKGRKFKKEIGCLSCGKITGTKQRKYCNTCRRKRHSACSKSKIKFSDKKLLEAYIREGSIPLALKSLGMHPAGNNYIRIKRIIAPIV